MIGGSGRCLCGAVRYRFDGAPRWQSHCHCESCRRATASGFTSFLAVSRKAVTWTGDLRAFASSAGVTRRFCPVCGTQMSYETDSRRQETDLYAATLDDASDYRPMSHDHWNEHLAWICPGDGLPLLCAPRRLAATDDALPVLDLIRISFAFMDGRIDPPSSAHRLTAGEIRRQIETGEVWVIEEPGHTVAAMFLSYRKNSLHLGKLAVAARCRRQGLARQMTRMAERRALAAGLQGLELETRIELTETHAAFRALGFVEAGATSHPGYDRPTSLIFRKPVAE